MEDELYSHAEVAWCPGCGNFGIRSALRGAILDLDREGVPMENVVIVTGIGQHGKMFDVMNINGFYGLHGRTIPIAAGIRLTNPELKVICIAGDGDCYAEGLEHLIFGAKRNLDITVLVHDNRVYGLTTGQFTPTSPYHYKGRSTPTGTTEFPFNPLELMLTSGATFIGRGYSRNREQLQALIRESVLHPGFSFVDILQICVTYNDLTDYYNARVYDWKEDDVRDFDAGCRKAKEWDYNSDAPIGLGVMFRREFPTFEDKNPVPAALKSEERKALVAKIMNERG
ncbi:MAG TPA: thiamine pyrophosphate-dependent enzyme [Methanoregulaceae archaeon]|nr:thiamine pyrophosphate-dependent enzyme [Methanoregulaceae archaeon]